MISQVQPNHRSELSARSSNETLTDWLHDQPAGKSELVFAGKKQQMGIQEPDALRAYLGCAYCWT